MDGREFVNMPPLGLSGLTLEAGRISSGNTGGRLMPSTGQLPPFCTAKCYPSPLGLHSQSGFPHLSRGVYHSYIPVSHLEPSGGVTPLLTRMGQHGVIDPQKDGFCYVGQQSTYYPQTSALKTSANQAQSLHENDAVCHSFKNSKETSKDSKEKVFRSEILLTPSFLSTAKKDRRFSEETQSVDLSDRELDSKAEKERKKVGLYRVPKQGQHHSSFISSEFTPNRWSGNVETKSKHPQTSLLSNHGCNKQPSRHEENIRPLCHTNSTQNKLGESQKNLTTQCTCPSSHPVNFFCKVASTTPVSTQPLHSSVYSIAQQSKERTNDIKTLAPNFVSTIETSDEHRDHIKVGSQASNLNGKELRRPEDKAQFSHSHGPQEFSVNETKRDVTREQGSVICCNSSIKGHGVSNSFSNNHDHVPTEKKIFSSSAEPIHCGQEDYVKETCKMSGLIDFHRQNPGNNLVKHPEEKPIQLENSHFTKSQIPVLATQHSQMNHEEEEGSKLVGSRKNNMESKPPSGHCERSAMQNLLKYSGNFEKETTAWQSSGKKSPFGGLGNMRMDEASLKDVKVHSLSQAEVKRDPDTPDSVKTVAKESLSFQGEMEVRNPPVGIAVAVARQKDSGGNKMLSSKGHTREESVDERIRHCNERLLLERLDREHAKLLRENKDLTDLSQMHSSGCAAIGLSPNLMVTGGTALSRPWVPDSTSHLAAHPWLSSGLMPCMWHADHPYGLAHPTLHEGINPSIPPGIAASLPSAYSLAREPRSGQIVVIPAEHLSHFAELLDLTSPLWPSMYSSAHTSMQHAHQLQLFSQQHLMRQHELYMLLQQEAAHSTNIHRGAQLDAAEPPRTEQPDVLDLQRNVDILELQRTAQLEAKEFQRKTQHQTQECHRREQRLEQIKPGQEKVLHLSPHLCKERSLCSSPSDSCGKGFGSSPLHLSAFSATNKLEDESDKPASEEPSFCSRTPASTLPAKVEVIVGPVKDTDMTEGDASPLQDPAHGYSMQCVSPSVQHQLSYVTQSTKVETDESFVSESKACHLEAPLNLKSVHVSEELEAAESPTDAIKKENVPIMTSCKISNERDVCAAPVECQHFSFPETEPPNVGEKEDEGEVESSSPCISEMNLGFGKGTCSTQTDFNTFESQNNEIDLVIKPQNIERSPGTEEVQDLSVMNGSASAGSASPGPATCKEEDMCSEPSDVTFMNDPLAGMNVLVAASEIPEAYCLPPRSNAVLVPDIAADSSLFQGIVLLSEIAETALERRTQTDDLQSCHIRPSLESLLAASSQMLMEVLSSPTLDRLKAESIKLPRELTPNKKYSWRLEASAQHFSIESALEDMAPVELDCRVRLAELQRRYKEKQRELAKLQRKRDSEEKSDEKIKTLIRRGPGRPKKRKHGIQPPLYHQERMKNSNNRKLSKCMLLSEKTKAGDCLQTTLLNISEVEELANERKSGIDDWGDHSSSSSYLHEFTDRCQEKQRNVRIRRRKSDFRQMHSIQLSRIVSKEDTDSEDDDNIIRNEWLSQPKPSHYSMCNMLTQKIKTLGRSPSPHHMSSFYRTPKPKQTHRNRRLCLLLPDQEAESSFSDSTEDSMDQGY